LLYALMYCPTGGFGYAEKDKFEGPSLRTPTLVIENSRKFTIPIPLSF